MTVTRKRFSVSSFMAPEIEPMAQQSVLRLAHDHSEPSTCFESFSVTASGATRERQEVARQTVTRCCARHSRAGRAGERARGLELRRRRRDDALIISVSTTSRWVR